MPYATAGCRNEANPANSRYPVAFGQENSADLMDYSILFFYHPALLRYVESKPPTAGNRPGT